MSTAPVINIDMQSFWQDPYPTLAKLRAENPIAFIPQLRGTVFTRRDDIYNSEKNIAVFSSHQPRGLMNKVMGVNMMRKDGADHRIERKAMFPSVSPQTVKEVWTDRFQNIADALIQTLQPLGKADFYTDFALPFSGECLKEITGLTNITYQEMDTWSQAMIDGVANYIGDPEIEARGQAATSNIDDAIDRRLPELKGNPDHSMLSVMFEAGMPMDSIRANIKLAISGGQNEPRDAIAGLIWALLTHPEEYRKIRDGDGDWMAAFDEFNRWISPIGMTPRRIAKPWRIHDIELAEDDMVFFMFSSANRDEDYFPDGDRFNISRDTGKSIPFGAGPHFCAGAWASKAMIGDVAAPSVFKAFKDLKITDGAEIRIGGWAFRGILNLPVEWAV